MILIIYLGVAVFIYGQTQLAIPDTLSGTKFHLTIQKGSVNFYFGFTTNTIGVNGSLRVQL